MKKFTIALCLATAFAASAFAQAPCTQTAKLNASGNGAQSWNGTKGATVVSGSGDDALGVEAWTEAGGNATKLTWFGPNQGGGSAFRAEWTNSTDYLGRFGYQWGTNGKKWDALGDLCVGYNYTRSANGSGGSYSYIGIYGWTIGSSNSAEYYIVEDWFGNNQQSASNLGSNCQTHNNITVDGKTYQVVTCIRPQGSGCVSCNNQAFGQVFSIRQGMRNSDTKTCGTISIKKHFEEWIKQTTEKGGQSPAKYIYDKTYESKFLVEAQGGTGWFEASWMKFSRTGACGGTTTPSSSAAVPSSSSKVASSSSRAVSSSSVASSSSRAVSSSSIASSSSRAVSSSSRAVSSSSNGTTGPLECGEYKASFCGGLAYGNVPSNSTTIPTTGNCLYIGDFEAIQPNLNSTVAINGVENTCGSEWGEEEGKCPFNTKPAPKDGGYYVYVKTGTINTYQNNGWKTIVAKALPACVPPASSSSGLTPSSSSEGETPILNSQFSILNSKSPTYYNIKGEPLGNVKPTKAGIYIVKQGSSVKKISVR